MKSAAKTLAKIAIEVHGQNIPVEVHRERRNGWRFAVTGKAAIIRMPLHLAAQEQEALMSKFRAWLHKTLTEKPDLHERFAPKVWKTGDVLSVGSRSYQLQVEQTDLKTHSARRHGNLITLELTRHDSDLHRQKAMTLLMSRVVAQDFLPEITRRVNELNYLYFQKPVRSVNLKYNLSNWGSCSSQLNINLSTRLLFAPPDVIDYVIIHELAHLVEMNHSDRFWRLVEVAMPDYREKENWLKKNWAACEF